jgi:hypothetical protein
LEFSGGEIPARNIYLNFCISPAEEIRRNAIALAGMLCNIVHKAILSAQRRSAKSRWAFSCPAAGLIGW